MTHENVERRKVIVDDEHWYLTVGDRSLTVTCPFENRPENREKRLVLDILCDFVYSKQRGCFRKDIVDKIEEIMGFSFNLNLKESV